MWVLFLAILCGERANRSTVFGEQIAMGFRLYFLDTGGWGLISRLGYPRYHECIKGSKIKAIQYYPAYY